MDREESFRKGAQVDFFLGSVLALGVIVVASLARSWMILVVVPVLGAVSLTLSWWWQNKIFRGFALTLVGLTLTAYAAYWLVYLPYIIGDWIGVSH